MVVRLALVEGAALLASVLAALLALPHPPSSAAGAGTLALRALALALCWLIAFYYADLYDLRSVSSLGRFVRRLPRALLLGGVLLGAICAGLPASRVPPRNVLASAGLAVLLTLLIRAAAYALARRRAEGVLLVGAGPLAGQLVQEITARPHLGWSVLGVVDDEGPGEFPLRARRFGPLSEVDRIIHEQCPDRIIVTLRERRGRLPLQPFLRSRLRGILVEDGVEVYERLTGKLAIESVTPSGLIFSSAFRKSPLHEAVDRGVSLLVAGLALLLSAPLLGLIALAIVVDSGPPVLFVQDRVGLGGRCFRLRKFRTMVAATKGRTSEWVRDNEDRITRVGKWLRRFRLDELPQLLDVLRGDMNLVGPRPHPFSNFPMFVVVMRNTPERGDAIPYYSLRCTVRPGITGWAQVRYRYANDLEEETEKMRYDLYYIKHASLGLDLRILLDTVKVVLLGRGAAGTARVPRVISLDSGVRRRRPTSPLGLPARGSGRSEKEGRVRHHPTAV